MCSQFERSKRHFQQKPQQFGLFYNLFPPLSNKTQAHDFLNFYVKQKLEKFNLAEIYTFFVEIIFNEHPFYL